LIPTQSQAKPGQGAPLTPSVIATVEADLAKLSRKKPTLPWNTSSRGKKRT
jgi:hypothetical protein